MNGHIINLYFYRILIWIRIEVTRVFMAYDSCMFTQRTNRDVGTQPFFFIKLPVRPHAFRISDKKRNKLKRSRTIYF